VIPIDLSTSGYSNESPAKVGVCVCVDPIFVGLVVVTVHWFLAVYKFRFANKILGRKIHHVIGQNDFKLEKLKTID